jgi:pSer/pThr/pTyr-binding forkhead associated (FHA) protein
MPKSDFHSIGSGVMGSINPLMSHDSMNRTRKPKIRIDLNDHRYPRHGFAKWGRTTLLGCWSLIGVYLGSVAINLYQISIHDPSQLEMRSAIAQAFLLPDIFGQSKTPLILFLPVIMLFFVLLGIGLWAVRDLAFELRVLRLRDAEAVAKRSQAAKRAATKTMPSSEVVDPSLLIISITDSTPATRVRLTASIISVGRDISNDIVIPDPTVSRHQLRLRRSSETWSVEAFKDAVPLFVNGQPQVQMSLQHGDQLVMGSTILRFEAPSLPSQRTIPESVPYLAVGCKVISFAVPLRSEYMTLGRAPDNALVIPSSIVSLHHAVLVRSGDGCYSINNSQSRNGLYFNGKPISRHTFRPEDTVSIGGRSGAEVVTLSYLESQIPPNVVEVDEEGISTLVWGIGLGKKPESVNNNI